MDIALVCSIYFIRHVRSMHNYLCAVLCMEPFGQGRDDIFHWHHICSRSTSSFLWTEKDTVWITWNQKTQWRRHGNQKGTGKELHHICCEREVYCWQEWCIFFAQLSWFQNRCSLTYKRHILLLLIVLLLLMFHDYKIDKK